MWNIYLREISTGEMNDLHWLLYNDAESGYRAKIILLRDEGYTVPEIRRITNHHDNNIRKWIHRFNEKGIDDIISRKHIRNAHKIRRHRKIVEIATNDPRKKYKLKFSTWSLRVLAGYIMEEMKLVESISHTEVKNVLVKHGIEWRNSKSAFNITMEYTPIQFRGVSLGMSVVLVLIGSSIGPSIAAIYMQTHQEVVTKEVSSISGGFFPSPISYNLIFLTAALVSTISIAIVIILKRKMMITQPLISSQKE